MLRVGPEPIDPAAMLAAFSGDRASSGAIASFTGIVRAEGGEVVALELEHYPGFTEAGIRRIMDEADARFALHASIVAHRVGRIAAGETVVFVAAAAAHRRAAFDAVDYMMDHLKTSAPFWKKQHGQGAARWIEPRPDDHAGLRRWSSRANVR